MTLWWVLTAAPHPCTTQWSSWINTDSPSTGDGDHEVFVQFYNFKLSKDGNFFFCISLHENCIQIQNTIFIIAL